jgi:hypothetical protein
VALPNEVLSESIKVATEVVGLHFSVMLESKISRSVSLLLD